MVRLSLYFMLTGPYLWWLRLIDLSFSIVPYLLAHCRTERCSSHRSCVSPIRKACSATKIRKEHWSLRQELNLQYPLYKSGASPLSYRGIIGFIKEQKLDHRVFQWDNKETPCKLSLHSIHGEDWPRPMNLSGTPNSGFHELRCCLLWMLPRTTKATNGQRKHGEIKKEQVCGKLRSWDYQAIFRDHTCRAWAAYT